MEVKDTVHEIINVYMETARLQIDVVKHLTTLSSGAIVILATFIDKVKSSSHIHIFVSIGILCLLICLSSCVSSLFSFSNTAAVLARVNIAVKAGDKSALDPQVAKFPEQAKKLGRRMTNSLRLAAYSFALGILALGIFVAGSAF